MVEHTPTPYRASGDLVFAGDNVLASVHDGQAPGADWMEGIAHANAAYIVRACNAHEALLAACEDLLSGWKYIRQVHGDLYGVGWDRAQQAGETAIANAKAGDA